MEIGLLTDSVGHLSRVEALELAVELGLERVELAVGCWSAVPHVDFDAVTTDASARRVLRRDLEERGLRVSALNASGNTLHPLDGAIADRRLRETLHLAGELGVDTVVLMSGLPAGAPGDTMPSWITTSWPPETTRMLEYQWNDVALPYWQGLVEDAVSCGVTRLAVEMHANQLVYNVPSLLRLREAVGPVVGANFDPSHLFWMGADPLAAVDALAGVIHHVHAKDTRLEASVAVRSRLETLPVERVAERSWNYVTVGRGHDADYWTRIMVALSDGGYDGTLSIEHEDHAVDPVIGVREAAAVLQKAAVASGVSA